jgi:hypothetical protein
MKSNIHKETKQASPDKGCNANLKPAWKRELMIAQAAAKTTLQLCLSWGDMMATW